MSYWSLMLESDAKDRELERAARANPDDLTLKRKRVTALSRSGARTPDQTALGHADLDYAEARRAFDSADKKHQDLSIAWYRSISKLGDKHPDTRSIRGDTSDAAAAFVKTRAKMNNTQGPVMTGARHVHYNGRNPLHSIHNHGNDDEHVRRMLEITNFVHRGHRDHPPTITQARGRLHHDGTRSWNLRSIEQARMFADGLRHHYPHYLIGHKDQAVNARKRA